MSLLVVGSLAFDCVETPTDRRDNVLGGSAVYFSYAASYFTDVRLVAVVGEDWPAAHTQLLRQRRVDVAGLQVVKGGKTFRWSGKYLPNMNDRETLEVDLNVFADFDPVVPAPFRDCRYVFLANGSPRVQMRVLEQMPKPQLVVADTMDLWINIERPALMELWQQIDGVVLNDSEARLLTDDENLVRAGRRVLELGPKFAVIKKGEHGALFFSRDETFVMPAYPTARVLDPTGAGDCFAGGLMGYLAERGQHDGPALKHALAYGTVVASFAVEDFSLDRLQQVERRDVDQRLDEYRRMLAL